LVIPQLLFSGVLVRFDRLVPFLSSHGRVPFIGNVMVSRWAHEAMAVYQFKNNAYERLMFPYETQMNDYLWRKDNWIKELENQLNAAKILMESKQDPQKLASHLDLIRNELTQELVRFPDMPFQRIEDLRPDRFTLESFDATSNFLSQLHGYYAARYVQTNTEKQKRIEEMDLQGVEGRDLTALKMANVNESLEDMLTNGTELTRLVVADGKLYQKTNLIFIDPKCEGIFGFWDAHFYAPSKVLFGKRVSTLSGNLFQIWMMVSILVVVLYFDGLKKLLHAPETLRHTMARFKSKA
jgi:hypothetical protein